MQDTELGLETSCISTVFAQPINWQNSDFHYALHFALGGILPLLKIPTFSKNRGEVCQTDKSLLIS